MKHRIRRSIACFISVGALLFSELAKAEVPVQRSFYQLPSSNGFGAIVLDLEQARLTHFREHLFATEEPELDSSGAEVWNGNQPAYVATRDILYDAYFGIRANGDQQWLTALPVDLDASGYVAWASDKSGGTGITTMVQELDDLELTQFFFAPQSLPHASFVMAMRIRNNGSTTLSDLSAFSIHNFHLGFGRPSVNSDIGEEGETIFFEEDDHADLIERAFAGVVVARALTPVSHHGASYTTSADSENVYAIVNNGGDVDLPDLFGQANTGDGSVSAYQFEVNDLSPGEEAWVGVVMAHHGDPFADDTVQEWLDSYVASGDAESLVSQEIETWKAFQEQSILLPNASTANEETVFRHAAVLLKMAQVQEEESYLREWLTTDGVARYTRFGTALGEPAASLPNTIVHRGKGAILASLPPGEWTYAWSRDGAYATVAMASSGMTNEASDALRYYLNAESGRFQNWSELSSYGMPPYQISLVRYHGFGVEETDFNDYGPNLEFDGFGLFLWALRQYEDVSGDTSVRDEYWDTVSSKIADALVGLVQPDTGLIYPDSSIWETHWNSRQRSWTYTNLAAVRGLCDAAALAERSGDSERADLYQETALSIRDAVVNQLTNAEGALCSNLEELNVGEGYWDAAVLDGIALGIFDPNGKIAKVTLAGLDANLLAPAGAGWSRNDDRSDHSGSDDLSAWGSEYDSAEWVITNLRGALATAWSGDDERSQRLMEWFENQTLENYLMPAETYDEGVGTYKFNAPMIGFGAGAYILALANRDGLSEPACGAYFDEGLGAGGGGGSGGSGGNDASTGGATSSAGSDDSSESGCSCNTAEGHSFSVFTMTSLACLLLMRRRKLVA